MSYGSIAVSLEKKKNKLRVGKKWLRKVAQISAGTLTTGMMR